MHLQASLRSAIEILLQYKGDLPFAAWLKQYFREHKKFGSRDRKQVTSLCFCYFRLGTLFPSATMEEKILIGQFLCNSESAFVVELKPQWLPYASLSLKEKLNYLGKEGGGEIFPFRKEMSAEIDAETFQLSFLQQPDLFLRIRRGKEEVVTQKLTAAEIPFEQEGTCLRLLNSVKVDEVLQLDTEAVVQDRSSQQVLQPLHGYLPTTKVSVWDCCAASGGKTILLHDQYPQARLMVSDIRESIIVNLRNRFKRAGLHQYRSFVGDVSSPQFSLKEKFDLIICDAPCSGSGTWARTPEQLHFFKAEKIAYYAGLQKKIAQNAIRFLNKGGFFLYLTCSVFAEENEKVVEHIQQNAGLSLLSQEYFKGYDRKSDTLFAALFTA